MINQKRVTYRTDYFGGLQVTHESAKMLRRCCFCFDLYKGSLLVAACRLAVWLLIFVGTMWVTVQVFSADRGVIVYQAWLDIEQNGERD